VINHADELPSPPSPPNVRVRPWVPVRSLSERHRARVLAHLLALPDADRYLRFGYAASDAQIAYYTDQIDFQRDAVFGIFNRRLQLLAVAHLAVLPEDPVHAEREAEFGVSVLPQARRRGYATRLFEHCVLNAATRGVDSLLVHALTENTAMLHIARKAGAIIEQQGVESEALLRLPEPTWRDSMAARLEDSAADWDYRLKVQARRLSSALNLVDDLRKDIAAEVESTSGLDGEKPSTTDPQATNTRTHRATV
jgi:ribosomal protein S18 acetylase RimI-like enzyme